MKYSDLEGWTVKKIGDTGDTGDMFITLTSPNLQREVTIIADRVPIRWVQTTEHKQETLERG